MAVLFMSAGFSACSSDSEPENVPVADYMLNRVKVLNGRFHSEVFSNATNTLDCEDVTFTPYTQPKEVFGVLSGDVYVWGEAVLNKYFNDHQLETKKVCYFTFTDNENFGDGEFSISFYGKADNGNTSTGEEKRYIKIVSNSEFLMRPFYSSDDNFKTYKKQ